MIHIASVTLVDFAKFFHATASLVAVGSRRNLFWLAVKIMVFLGVVAWHVGLLLWRDDQSLRRHRQFLSNRLLNCGFLLHVSVPYVSAIQY